MNYAIIAAGEGSRLAQEGVKWPKPLVRLNDTALIDRLIQIFLNNKATAIRVIVNEEMKEVQEHLRGLELPVPFHLLVKSTPSSLHSFYELCKDIESDEICLTTVDTIFREEEFGAYIDSFRKAKDLDGLMAVTDYIDDEKPLYVKTDKELRILNFLDKTDGECRYISGGIYCLRRPAIAALEPDGVRVYPTVIVRDTALYDLWKAGRYREHTVEDAVRVCARILPIFEAAGIPVIRLGLNPTEDLSGGDAVGGAYHPALGELVKSRIMREKAEALLSGAQPGSEAVIRVNPRLMSQLVGQHGANRAYLIERFGLKRLRVKPDAGVSCIELD